MRVFIPKKTMQLNSKKAINGTTAVLCLLLLSTLTSASAYQAGETFRDCPTCPVMVVVPEGEFLMGSPNDEKGRWDDEGPQRQVTISKPFAVGKYEVTVGQFKAFIDATKYFVLGTCEIYESGDWDLKADLNWKNPGFEQTEKHPVVCVAWDDAKAYTNWLSRETGKTYRLLSEAEWEYVARAGTTTAYHFGTTISAEQANYDKVNNGTVEVGQYDPNKFQLYDIHGNVWEWVEDCWHDDYRGAPLDSIAWSDGCDSIEDSAGVNITLSRGGAWTDDDADLRSAFRRNNNNAWSRDNETGFRVARDLTP